ncbi:hypothetical protein C8E02_1795 [Vogesella indigofera]|uniref:Uncharacterized protein n=2 Tax=Vogesella indigofera TaxID=45465 RepID=A0A495BDK8_VOGIN|nr:hypothetical protein C8E02_1795 [Vogesella indigofera]
MRLPVCHMSLLPLYARLQQQLPAGSALTLLQLDGDETRLASGSGSAPPRLLSLPLGYRRTAQQHFRHQPPTAAEIELAIMTVEDALAPARAQLAPASLLYSQDGALRALAAHAGVHGSGTLWLSTAQLEFTFGRFAEVVQGRPAALEGLPTDGEFAARLLILRELSHHLGFDGIHLLPL